MFPAASSRLEAAAMACRMFIRERSRESLRTRIPAVRHPPQERNVDPPKKVFLINSDELQYNNQKVINLEPLPDITPILREVPLPLLLRRNNIKAYAEVACH